ncbi:hypothetical protein J1614_001193 [Plenodomus biglobosus]|nr:hypothetical protein J1614_001193 [Plenodomus biglobosus]
MLAPRILHFCQDQIFWDCTEMSACESLPGGLPLPLDRLSSIDRHWRGRLQEGGSSQSLQVSAANDDSPEDFWKAAVENYTSLDLTKQVDKRLAVWGIAKLVRDSLDEEYAVGMWGLFLEEQLAWKVADHAASQRPEALRVNPSWAWVSIHGRIIIQDRSGRRDRVYRVKSHEGQPLSFNLIREDVRPRLPRETSGDRNMDIANMSKDLELADERRRKSSATSRHNSQVGLPTSRHSSQANLARKMSDKILLSKFEKSARSTVQETWSWKPVDYNVATRGSLELRWFYSIAALFASLLALLHQLVSWFWCLMSHGISTLRVLISRTQLAPKSGYREHVPDSRDVEPELSDKRIALQGYVHRGELQWSGDTGGYLLLPSSIAEHETRDTLVDAYPDTTEDIRPGTVLFVILALSQKVEQCGSVSISNSPGRGLKTWYEGHGIMLSSSGVGQDYFRIGALQIRYLGAEMWQHIQTVSWEQAGSATDREEWKGEKFWVA